MTTTTAAVAGTSVEQAAPPTTAGAQVEAATLPRTGARIDTAPLVTLAGLLLLIGGALMAWTNRPLPL